MQLVAYGAQDIYLTGNPTITHFKVIYRRHTNFSTETVAQTFDGVVAFGNRVSATITRNADLVRGMYIQATLPDLYETSPTGYDVGLTGSTGPMNRYMRWVDNVGHHLLQRIDIEIGGQLIDRQYGDWLDIWAQLTVPAGLKTGYYKMIGQDPHNAMGQNTGLQQDIYSSSDASYQYTNIIKGRDIYVPLQFWFCRNVGLALPLVALQYHDIKVTVLFRQINDLVMVWNDGVWQNTLDSFNQYVLASPAGTFLDATLWVDYVYLDTDERQRFAKVSHEYLIEQVQFTGDEYCIPAATGQTVGSFNSYRLNFNHPVKELIWVVRGFESSKQWSNYTDTKLQNKPPITYAGITTGGGTTVGITGLDTNAPFTIPPSTGYLLDPPSLATVNYNWDYFSNFNTVRPTGRPTGSSTDPQSCRLANNPIVTGTILLNGQERFAARPGSYFNLVQTRQSHTNIPESPGINVYSFALKPEDHQPSGTCNFSRIDNATLNIYIGRFYEPTGSTYTQETPATISSITSATVKIYAFGYNILRIMNGMAGLAYSN